MTLQTDLIAHISHALTKYDLLKTELAKADIDVSLAYLRTQTNSGRSDIVNAKTKANTLIDLYADLLPYNVNPIAVDDQIVTPKNTAITFAASVIMANDSDADDIVLRVGNVLNPVNGTVVMVNANTIRFTPTTDFEGVASFEYRVYDPHNVHDTGLVTVLVGEQQQPAPEFWQGLATVWPDATTTGCRTATTNWTSGTPSGTVIGKRFTGYVRPANNTIFEDCIFEEKLDADELTVTVRHSTFLGSGESFAILGSGTFERNDISGYVDAIKVQGNNSVVRDNYIHDPWSGGVDPHNDAIEVYGPSQNVLIERNRVQWRDTSEVYISPAFGNIDGVAVRHNYMGGSDFPVKVRASGGGSVTNVTVSENVILRGHWGYFDVDVPITQTGNLDAVTGAAL